MNSICSLHQYYIYLYFSYFKSFAWFSGKRKNILRFLKHWLLVVYVQQYYMNCCSWTWIQSWFTVQRFHLEIKHKTSMSKSMWWHRSIHLHKINIRSFGGSWLALKMFRLFCVTVYSIFNGFEFWKFKSIRLDFTKI